MLSEAARAAKPLVYVATHRLLRMIDMPTRNTTMGPQDIKLAPDGSVFYIADSDQNGLWVLDGAATTVLREIPTGWARTGSTCRGTRPSSTSPTGTRAA